MDGNTITPGIEPARHWINGEWVSSSTVANSVSPSTGEVLEPIGVAGLIVPWNSRRNTTTPTLTARLIKKEVLI
jgi:hypothetical protein